MLEARMPGGMFRTAAELGYLGVVKYTRLLLKTQNVLIVEGLVESAMRWASYNGHTSVVDYLLDQGVAPSHAMLRANTLYSLPIPKDVAMYADRVYNFDIKFSNLDQAHDYFESPTFIKWAREEFGLELPFLFVVDINGEEEMFTPNPTKQGIPMDWRFYSEIDKITAADISAETNIEKRRLLIMEYGVNNYLQDVKALGTDVYGTLIKATIEGMEQQFVKVRNGTEELEEDKAFLREKNMLTADGHKIYYIPVSSKVRTAKQGIEESWGLPKGTLPNAGWDYES